MVLVALFIGVILIVAAIRNSQGTLFSALGQDVPDFIVWGAAIFAIGVLGFVPGLKPISRGLLALIIVVLVLNNYKNILQSFQSTWQNPGKETQSNKTVRSALPSLSDILNNPNAAYQYWKQQGAIP